MLSMNKLAKAESISLLYKKVKSIIFSFCMTPFAKINYVLYVKEGILEQCQG